MVRGSARTTRGAPGARTRREVQDGGGLGDGGSTSSWRATRVQLRRREQGRRRGEEMGEKSAEGWLLRERADHGAQDACDWPPDAQHGSGGRALAAAWQARLRAGRTTQLGERRQASMRARVAAAGSAPR
jgi:hypothetical protein